MTDTTQLVEAMLNRDTVLVHELFNEAMMGIIADRLDEKRAEISKKLFEKKSCKEGCDGEMDGEEDNMDDLEEGESFKSDDGNDEAPVGGTKPAKPNMKKGDAAAEKTIKSDDGRVETKA